MRRYLVVSPAARRDYARAFGAAGEVHEVWRVSGATAAGRSKGGLAAALWPLSGQDGRRVDLDEEVRLRQMGHADQRHRLEWVDSERRRGAADAFAERGHLVLAPVDWKSPDV